MGNRESVMFVYMLNCVICILFLIQGVLMWRAAKPTLEMIEFLKAGGVENVPADLKRHTNVESFIQQRNKFKYCIFASLFNFLLILLSTLLRLMVTFETERQEAKLLSNISQDQVKDHY